MFVFEDTDGYVRRSPHTDLQLSLFVSQLSSSQTFDQPHCQYFFFPLPMLLCLSWTALPGGSLWLFGVLIISLFFRSCLQGSKKTGMGWMALPQALAADAIPAGPCRSVEKAGQEALQCTWVALNHYGRSTIRYLCWRPPPSVWIVWNIKAIV